MNIKLLIGIILRRVFKRDLSNIVAPLKRMADELARLQKINSLDNAIDHQVIERIESRISARNIESVSAHSTEDKIRSLLH